MQARKLLCMFLVLALMVGLIAPCGSVFATEQTLYGENLEQVTAPVVGEEYYLGADTSDGMVYFSHSTFTNTAPYSLYTRTNFAHKWTVPVTLESPEVLNEEYSEGFQMVYTYVKGDGTPVTSRIYCIDDLKDSDTVTGQTGVMDTGATDVSNTAYKNRHNFYVDDVDHWIRSTFKNDHVLVAKKLLSSTTDKEEWRMLFVPETELANEGVYPVMLLQEHAHKFTDSYVGDQAGHKKLCWCGATAAQTEAHTYGAPVVNDAANTVTRTCSVCGYAEVVFGQDLQQVVNPVVDSEYYLVANVEGAIRSFITGSYTQTSPYSIITSETLNTVTVKAALEEGKGEFQLMQGGEFFVYSVAAGVGLSRAAGYVSDPNKISFSMDEVNGVKVLRAYGTGKILAAKYSDAKSQWRIFPVEDSDIGTAGVYPVMLASAHTHDYTTGKPQGDENGHTEVCWCGAKGTKTEGHTFGAATITGDVATRTCTVCDYAYNVYDHKVAVTAPTIGSTYYLAANVNGKLNFFISGKKTTDVNPYALHVTDDAVASQQVTLEDYTETGTTNAGKGFQMTFPNPDTTSASTTLRIYCYDVLKDNDTVTGQTGVMDTGHNGSNTANGHTFFMDDVDGVKVLRKYSTTAANQVILVVKYNETTGTYRMLGVPESELANEGVYPVMFLQEHAHEAGKEIAGIDDNGHSYSCWCGGIAKTEAHTYGKPTHDLKTKTTTRTCTVCGYVAAAHGNSQLQVKYPTIGETYNLVVNVNGQILSFTTGGYTQTTPYSIITSTTINTVQLQAALEAGKGEFQIVYNNGTDDYPIYSVSAGVGLSKSAGYVSDPTKVSFSMDEVNGVKVLRAYGTGKILAAKYSEAKAAWRIFPVDDNEIGTNGVYPVMLTVEHTEHLYNDNTWYFDEEAGTQSHLCSICGGAPIDTMHGTELKATQVTEPVIGNSYYLAANVNGKLMTFTSGGVTETDPYSLRTAMLSNNSIQVTLEAAVTEGKGEFQMTFPSTDSNGNPITARIYCYDVSSDHDYDTGTNSNNGANFHTFSIDEVNGVKVLRKYYNNQVLVVKQIPVTIDGVTTNQWRMQGVPESELGTDGVYPVMLMDLHEHSFGEELFSNDEGHYTLCNCDAKNPIPHSFGDWTLDRVAQTQTATCVVCDHTVTVRSPYFDTVDSLEELKNSLAETVLDEETNTYTVTGGKDFYLMAEIGDDFYYFRNGGSGENTSSTVSETTGHSLYTTNDPSHDNIIKAKVIPGNTENTYIIHAGKAINRVVYIRDEGADGIMDTGTTAFLGTSTSAAYKARSEFMWDEATGCLYQLEGDVKYVLVMKQMTNTKTKETEWRMVGVPEAEVEAAGNYPVVLVNHVHNLSKNFAEDNGTYYRACGCGYHATVTGNIALGENIGLHFDVKLEAGETVTATVDGETVSVELTENGAKHKAFVPLAAAQMTDEVKLTIGEDALDAGFTVQGIANAILADESYNQYAKDLVEDMLSYGAAAQTYFGHNTENLAGEETDVTMPTMDTGVQIYNDFKDVAYYGASVIHEGATAVRFYFIAESVEGLTFTVDGNIVEAAQKDGKYYIEVPCDNPRNMDQDINVVVTDGQQNLAVQYSPLTYIVRTYNRADASAELKALVKAMYGYHKAAKTYIANMYLGNDFALKNQTKTSLYEGVDQYASTYVAAGEGEVKAYAITIKADANVQLKVSAGEWSASSTAENPGGTKTVVKHFRDMKSAGNNVLAMINGGFFDLNSGKTMKPYGMQIVDGVVKQAPVAGKYSNNWFGMTKDGKYVISDAEGYASTYINNVQQGIGGGQMLIIGGQVQDIDSSRDYRTAVGVNAAGDLVLVAVENATYNDICQIFVDLNMDIVTVLNLDGGGSTAMYVPGAFYPKALILGEDGLLPREVADAVGVVVKP